MDEKIHHYIESLIPKRTGLFAEMEEFAREQGVPIMESVGIEVMLQMLRIQRPARILEIGTAIGYSALRMAAALPGTEIVSVERDEERYKQAISYLDRSEHGRRVKVLFGDALDLSAQARELGPYDAIFIDAAKGQYKRFFDMYSLCLAERGVIYTDNVLFKGHVAGIPVESKRIDRLVKKIQSYNEWLMNHEEYDTIIIPAGDGLAISRKRGEE